VTRCGFHDSATTSACLSSVLQPASRDQGRWSCMLQSANSGGDIDGLLYVHVRFNFPDSQVSNR
jgi:hypothetical protein